MASFYDHMGYVVAEGTTIGFLHRLENLTNENCECNVKKKKSAYSLKMCLFYVVYQVLNV